jgi:hypothetical protein
MAPPFLALALDGVEWSALRSCRFSAGEKTSSTHWIGVWVGPRAGLDALSYKSSAQTPQKTYIIVEVFTVLLPSTSMAVFVAYFCTLYPATDYLPRISLRGTVFIEPLPSSGSIRHNIYS